MKQLILLCLMNFCLKGQNVVSWSATTGDVALVAAGTTATIQKTATNSVMVTLTKAIVYCSVACTVTQAANGTAATATAGTIRPILPDSPTGTLPFNFYTASNVGAGTAQGGIVHIPAGGTVILCLSKSCGNAQDVVIGRSDGGVGTNYSIAIGSVSGTVNITFFGTVKS
jgi:hypothetical protein